MSEVFLDFAKLQAFAETFPKDGLTTTDKNDNRITVQDRSKTLIDVDIIEKGHDLLDGRRVTLTAFQAKRVALALFALASAKGAFLSLEEETLR